MIASDLTTGVTQRIALIVPAVAVAGGWLGGAAGALGVLAGGALAILSFRLLVARATAAAADGPALTAPWVIVAGLRFVAVGGVQRSTASK
jgi:hypothetical protein